MKEKLTKKVRHTNASSDFYSIQLSNSRLNALVSQLQGAINTLEKVGELSRMGNKLSSGIAAPPPLDAPSSAHIPVSAEVLEESRESSSAHPAPPAFPGVDLQSALQSLGPLLSMLGNNQNPK